MAVQEASIQGSVSLFANSLSPGYRISSAEVCNYGYSRRQLHQILKAYLVRSLDLADELFK